MIKVTPGSFWDRFWDANQPGRAWRRELRQANGRLQALVSDHGEAIPNDILKAISDLDWLINGKD